MIVFLDENIPKSAATILCDKGYDVIDVRGTKQEGLDDRKMFSLAKKRKALFLTTDRDFFHTIAQWHPRHCSRATECKTYKRKTTMVFKSIQRTRFFK